jgi:hypothetical protein
MKKNDLLNFRSDQTNHFNSADRDMYPTLQT